MSMFPYVKTDMKTIILLLGNSWNVILIRPTKPVLSREFFMCFLRLERVATRLYSVPKIKELLEKLAELCHFMHEG